MDLDVFTALMPLSMIYEMTVVLMLIVLLIFVAFIAFSFLKRKLWLLGSPSNKILDESLVRNPPKNVQIEFDQTKRDKVLKNGFSLEKVPENLDAIVIGSGAGGLSAAALLAKAGKKVLVLEQHDQAGGCCHVFADKGFEFDVGIHYVGKMNNGQTNRLISDQLTNGKLQWVQLDETYDLIAMGQSYETKYQVMTGIERQMEYLIKRFPNEEKAIRKFYKLVEETTQCSIVLVLIKLLPRFLSKFLLSSQLLLWLYPSIKYLTKTVSEVLDEITDNVHLRSVFSYAFGNYGTPPNQGSFLVHLMFMRHFSQGSYYPVGGSSEIAYNMIPVIESGGGCVLVRVKVKEILIKDGRAIGVKVIKGCNEHDLYAPVIISDAGLMNTVNKLLPSQVAVQFGMDRLVKQVKPGPGYFVVFIGLDGTKDELGLSTQNVWAFKDPDISTSYNKYISLTADESCTMDVPLMFLSFTSAKDPTFNVRYPGKSTCAIITYTPYEWFEEWKDNKVMHRGEDYNSLKMEIGRRLWQQTCELFPHLEDKLEYMEVGTPLSNQYYLEAFKGQVYGLDHNVERFDPSVQMQLRAETPISGLYLTGQDTLVDGLSGALHSGIFCASAILKHNFIAEFRSLRKSV